MTRGMQVRRVPTEVETGADYTSRFELTPAGGDAQTWARAVFGGAPKTFRGALRLGWRAVLLLRLRGHEETLGWRAAGGARSTTLSASGPLLDAANRVERVGDALTWTTVVGYRSPIGRVLWTLAAPLHHLTLPWLLRRAARQLAAP